MPRIMLRFQVMKWVVFLLAGLLTAPVFDARDLACSRGGAFAVFASGTDGPFVEGTADAYEEDTDSQNLFSCMLALETPGILLVPTGEVLNPARLHLQYASHLPKIYHPPIT